jgi:protein-tyrosine phosphatase
MYLMTATPANLAQKIDQLGYLSEREAEAKPQRDELAKLKSELHLHCVYHPVNRAVRLQGNAYYVDLTARANRLCLWISWRETPAYQIPAIDKALAAKAKEAHGS